MGLSLPSTSITFSKMVPGKCLRMITAICIVIFKNHPWIVEPYISNGIAAIIQSDLCTVGLVSIGAAIKQNMIIGYVCFFIKV